MDNDDGQLILERHLVTAGAREQRMVIAANLGFNDAFAVPCGEASRATASAVCDNLDTRAGLAALCVHMSLEMDNLEKQRFTYGDHDVIDSSRQVLKAQVWRARMRYPRGLAIAGLVLLILIEAPRWCLAQGLSAVACRDPAGYHTFGWGLLGRVPSLTIEACVVAILAFDLWLWGLVRCWVGFSRSRDRMVHASILGLMLTDIGVALLLLPWAPASWRLAPYLRVVLLMSYSIDLQIGQALHLLRFLGELLKVLFPLAAVVLFFAWSGVLLFADHASTEFQDFGHALWSMMDLITTNNFPNVMVDMIEVSRVNFIFFFLFLFLSIWLLLPAIVAVVSGAYSSSREQATVVAGDNQGHLLDEAFTILEGCGVEALEKEHLAAMLTALHSFGGPASDDDAWQSVVFAILDRTGELRIDRHQFSELPKVLSLSLRPVRVPWLEHNAPNLWTTLRCQRLRSLLDSAHFELAICTILIISLVINVVDSYPLLAGQRHVHREFRMRANVPFSFLLLGEVFFKLIIFGWEPYWTFWKNRFDAATTFVNVFSVLYVIIPDGYADPGLIQVSLMLCAIRAARLAGAAQFFKSVNSTVVAVTPKVFRVLPVISCALLAFDVLGCDLFGGLITTNASSRNFLKLQSTGYGRAGYWPLNFNDPASGMLTLVSCFVVNSADQYVIAFMAVAGNWASIYFVVWFVLGVCLLLNLLMSVAIDAWVAQGAIQDGGETVLWRTFDASVVTGTPTGVAGCWRAQIFVKGDGATGQEEARDELLRLTSAEPWCE